MKTAKVLILPGWLNSGPTHWQSRWEARHGYQRVEQHDWTRPLRGDWIARLEDVVLSHDAAVPLLLAAHSLGCHLVAAWAAHSQNTHRVIGALLVAPPDVSREDFPVEMHNWRRPVLAPLPFAATCVVSASDPFSSLAASRQLAAQWCPPPVGRCVEAGPLGHINGDSGLGDWALGHQLLLELTGGQK